MEKKETTLKRVRASKGFTQRSLSEATGMSLRTIQHWEQGSKDFNQAAAMTVYKVAQVLGVEMIELLDIPEPEETDENVLRYQRKHPSGLIIEMPGNEEEELSLEIETKRARELFERTKKQLKGKN